MKTYDNEAQIVEAGFTLDVERRLGGLLNCSDEETGGRCIGVHDDTGTARTRCDSRRVGNSREEGTDGASLAGFTSGWTLLDEGVAG